MEIAIVKDENHFSDDVYISMTRKMAGSVEDTANQHLKRCHSSLFCKSMQM
jgi:hypothetical protein